MIALIGPTKPAAGVMAELVVGVSNGRPVYLREVAALHDGPAPLTQPLNVPGPADVVPTAPQVLPALTPVVPAPLVPMAGAAQ